MKLKQVMEKKFGPRPLHSYSISPIENIRNDECTHTHKEGDIVKNKDHLEGPFVFYLI